MLSAVDTLCESRAIEVRILRDRYPRIVGSVLSDAMLTYRYAMRLGSPLVVYHLRIVLLAVVLVEILPINC